MARLVRSLPRRSPNRYPVGTTLTLRDGRTFEVATESYVDWYDPTEGNGGGNWETFTRKIWKLVPFWQTMHHPDD